MSNKCTEDDKEKDSDVKEVVRQTAIAGAVLFTFKTFHITVAVGLTFPAVSATAAAVFAFRTISMAGAVIFAFKTIPFTVAVGLTFPAVFGRVAISFAST